MSDKAAFTIELPVHPKDVFRLLALRSITETDGLFNKILANFDSIFNGVDCGTERTRFGSVTFAMGGWGWLINGNERNILLPL